MKKSTFLFLATAAIGAPAWIVDLSAVPELWKVFWLGAELLFGSAAIAALVFELNG